jgi:trans-2,3-dihydro-3-hydroxyanthranilate isomerase
MPDLEYRHVDVFSQRALRGNGLVVVLGAASLPAAVMQDVTREVRQFETERRLMTTYRSGPSGAR